jgi:hypothetical protein
MSDVKSPYIVSIGGPVPPMFDNIPNIGGILDMDRHGILVGAAVDNAAPEEVKAAREDPLHVGLFQHKDALFILVQIGRVAMFDLSYNVAKVHPDDRGLPDRDPDAGFAFQLIFGDSITKKVEALRFATVSPHFSRLLEVSVGKMQKRLEAGTYDFNTAYQEVMMKYADPSQMTDACLIFEQAGRKFTDLDRSMAAKI